jgi:hypothetical protein
MLSRLRHMFGHQWSEWGEPEPSSCMRRRHCTQCRRPDTPIEDHDWSERRYVSETTCEQTRTCSRCGREAHGTEHEYPTNSVTCEDATCLRCGEVRRGRGHSIYGGSGGYDFCYDCDWSSYTSVMN